MKQPIEMIWQVQKAIKSEANMRTTLQRVKRRLELELETLKKAVEVQTTGWYVLLKIKGDSFECVGIFNPDKSEQESEPEWDFALPIPKPETYPEFQGW